MRPTGRATSKLAEIRLLQRSRELESIKRSIRFSSQFQSIQEDDSHPHLPLTAEKLSVILAEGNTAALYEAVIEPNFEEEDILLASALSIIDFLRKRLSHPICIMILCELAYFDIFTILAFEKGCFGQVVENLERFGRGTQGELICLWALYKLTSKQYLIDKNQISQLIPTLSCLTVKALQKKEENIVLLCLLKNCSEVGVRLDEAVLLCLTNFYWSQELKIIRNNIYLICLNVLEGGLFISSTKALVQILIVCLKGKHDLEKKIHFLVPSDLELATKALTIYNQKEDEWEKTFECEIDSTLMTLGIHTFMTLFEVSFFSKSSFNLQQIQFLGQFFSKAPVGEIFDSLLREGTFETILSSLSEFPNTCEKSLQLLEIIGLRIREEENSEYLLERFKSEAGIIEMVEMTNTLFCKPREIQLSHTILNIFSGNQAQL